MIDALKDKRIDVAIGDITNLRIDDFYTEELYDEDYFVIYSKERGELNNSDINISAEQIYVQTPPCDTLRFIKVISKIQENIWFIIITLKQF